MLKPTILIRLEGLAALVLSVIAFFHVGGNGWWFALLFLSPDLFMAGYFIDKRVGAAVYNTVHTYAAPAALLMALWWFGQEHLVWLPFIWTAHIGFDRLLGYGLKYETAFKDTHLQRV